MFPSNGIKNAGRTFTITYDAPGSNFYTANATITVPVFQSYFYAEGIGGGGAGAGINSTNQYIGAGGDDSIFGSYWTASGGGGAPGRSPGVGVAPTGTYDTGYTGTSGGTGAQSPQVGGNGGAAGGYGTVGNAGAGGNQQTSSGSSGYNGSNYGGGGGGATWINTSLGAGGGGAGGSYAARTFSPGEITYGASITLTVGAKGLANNTPSIRGGNGAPGYIYVEWG